MADDALVGRLSETAKVAAKRLPIVGDVISILEELNAIWRPAGDDILKEALRSEFIIEDFVRRLSPHLLRIERLDDVAWEHAAELSDLRVALQARSAELQTLLSRVPALTTHVHLRELLIGAWLELGAADPRFPDDLTIAVDQLDDCALWVLLWVSDHVDWSSATAADLARVSSRSPRRVFAALRALHNMGICQDRLVMQDAEMVPFAEREFMFDVREARRLLDALMAIPTVAVAPDLDLAGFKRAREDRKLDEMLRSTSVFALRHTSLASVRRHLFDGYQWTLRDRRGWESADSRLGAIQAATEALKSAGLADPLWMFLPLGASVQGS